MAKKIKYRVALTGATGFLGKHVLDELVAADYNVRALTRRDQPLRQGVEWVRGDLTDPAALAALVKRSDMVIHVAGLTKANSRSEFFQVNRDGTERLLRASRDAGVTRFLLISSLAAREPQLSHYAASKAAAESLVLDRTWPFERLVIRPPGIYGPGDMEILKILKTTKYGILPAPGSVKNRFSMIHGIDLARGIVASLEAKDFNHPFAVEMDDGHTGGYTIKQVAKALADGTEAKQAKTLPLPRVLLMGIGGINLMISKATGKAPMLTPAKANELSHADWAVHEVLRWQPNGWSAEYDLASGMKNTIEWYRQQDLL